MGRPLKRDMDLIRSLLLEIEDGRRVFDVIGDDVASALGVAPADAMPADEAERLDYHLRLLNEAGFAKFHRTGGSWLVDCITWNGHEFLDTIRDPEVWKRTKEGAKKAGNASVSLVWEIAKTYAKHVASERLGIPLS